MESTHRFRRDGPTRVFFFWSKAGKFKISRQRWKFSTMKGSVGFLAIAMRSIDFEAIFISFVQF